MCTISSNLKFVNSQHAASHHFNTLKRQFDSTFYCRIAYSPDYLEFSPIIYKIRNKIIKLALVILANFACVYSCTLHVFSVNIIHFMYASQRSAEELSDV